MDADSINIIEDLLPPFLQNAQEEIFSHKEQASLVLTNLLNEYELLLSHCKDILSAKENHCCYPTEYTKYQMLLKKLQKECGVVENKAAKLDELLKGTECELLSLKQQNQQIREELVQLSEDIVELAAQEELLSKQRKEDFKSAVSLKKIYDDAKNKYKKLLLCHIHLSDQVDQLQGSVQSEHKETLVFSYLRDDSKTSLLKVDLSRENNNWKSKLMSVSVKTKQSIITPI